MLEKSPVVPLMYCTNYWVEWFIAAFYALVYVRTVAGAGGWLAAGAAPASPAPPLRCHRDRQAVAPGAQHVHGVAVRRWRSFPPGRENLSALLTECASPTGLPSLRCASPKELRHITRAGANTLGGSSGGFRVLAGVVADYS